MFEYDHNIKEGIDEAAKNELPIDDETAVRIATTLKAALYNRQFPIPLELTLFIKDGRYDVGPLRTQLSDLVEVLEIHSEQGIVALLFGYATWNTDTPRGREPVEGWKSKY